MLSSLRRTVSVSTSASVSVSILVYLVVCIVLLRGYFGGLSSALVAFSAVGRTCDGCSFGSILSELTDWFYCVPKLDLATSMPSDTTWRLPLFRFPIWGVRWLQGNWLGVVLIW